jgi:hypothetical protein
MRQVLAVAAREFVERRLVIASGAVLAVLILFTPLLPGVGGFSRGDIVGVASGWVSVMILLVGALIMGMTSINGDLTERRLGFYFSRPMSGFAIWLGKVAGTLAVVFVTAAITFLPAAADGFSSLLELEPARVVVFASTLVALFFFGHVAACSARVRSIWILLDIAGLFVLVVGIVTLFRSLFRLLPIDRLGETGKFILNTAVWSFQALVGMAVAASAAGFILGRVDRMRVHRWTSIALWTLVGSGLLAAWIALSWISAATPRDIRSGARLVHPEGGEGEWISISGKMRSGLDQEFVMNHEGRHLTMGSRVGLMASASRLVAIEPVPAYRFKTTPNTISGGTIVVADLDGELEWRRTKIDVEAVRAWGTRAALSRGGSRLAISTESGLAIYSLPDETMVRAVAVDLTDTRMLFVDDDRLRIFRRMRSSGESDGDAISKTEVLDVVISSGRQERRLSFDGASFAASASGHTILTRHGNERRVIDVESGLTIGAFESNAHLGSVRWLSDGTLAVPDDVVSGDGKVLRVVTREGDEVRRFELPDVEWLRLGHEPRPGVLMAMAVPAMNPDDCRERRLLEIDLESGVTREAGRGMTTLWSLSNDVPPGSSAARSFVYCDGRLVRYDPGLERSEAVQIELTGQPFYVE